MKYVIVLNAAQCTLCKRVLISVHRHDFVQCADGNFVDGGKSYLRRGGDPATMVEMSIMREKREGGNFYRAGDLPEPSESAGELP